MNQIEQETISKANENKELFMLIEPTHFYSSEEAQNDNGFMETFSLTKEESTKAAISEHQRLVAQLRSNGVAVKVFKQTCPEAMDNIYASDTLLCFKNFDFPTGLVVQCPCFGLQEDLKEIMICQTGFKRILVMNISWTSVISKRTIWH